MTRTELLEEVAGELDDVLTLAKLLPVDDATNLGGPLNRTFRALGATQAELPTAVVNTGAEEAAVAWANYFVLLRAVNGVVAKMNVSAGAAKADLHQQYENLKDRLEYAEKIAVSYGLVIGSSTEGVYPIVWAGGVTHTDYDAMSGDTDRIEPFFSSQDVATPGIGRNLRRVTGEHY